MKVEVNPVFRGTVLPVAQRPLTKRTADMFATALVLPVLDADELYGGKLVAALDRQHPRDLFDVEQMYGTDGLTDGAVECAVTYLAGHNRPIHEVLFATAKDIEREYRATFIGMTTEPVSLDTLYAARTRLFAGLPRRLTESQRQFLTGLAHAQPEWKLLRCPHAESLPALRWKLSNLELFRERQPKRFKEQAQTLEDKLASDST